jgi:hypothetical protein
VLTSLLFVQGSDVVRGRAFSVFVETAPLARLNLVVFSKLFGRDRQMALPVCKHLRRWIERIPGDLLICRHFPLESGSIQFEFERVWLCSSSSVSEPTG